MVPSAEQRDRQGVLTARPSRHVTHSILERGRKGDSSLRASASLISDKYRKYGFIRKMTPWKYEREWRYLCLEEFAKETTFLDENNLPVFLYELNLDSVKEITFGYFCSAEKRIKVMSVMNRFGNQIKYFQIDRPNDKYGFVRIECPVTLQEPGETVPSLIPLSAPDPRL